MSLQGGSLDGTNLTEAPWVTGVRVTHARLEGHPLGDKRVVVLHVGVSTPGAGPEALPRIIMLVVEHEHWPTFIGALTE